MPAGVRSTGSSDHCASTAQTLPTISDLFACLDLWEEFVMNRIVSSVRAAQSPGHHYLRALGRSALIACALSLDSSAQAAVGTLADSNGEIVAWGNGASGQTSGPSGMFTAI